MTPLGRPSDSVLICLDLQESLLADMPEPSRSRMQHNVISLLHTSEVLDIPVRLTERYPTGLGHTIRDVQEALPVNAESYEKDQFSCACENAFLDSVRATHRRQAVVTGVESHICVLQTALELHEDGFEVYVVDDAICSQRVAHWKSALDRLRQAGVIVAPTESILSEWMREATQEQFRRVSTLLQ